MEIGDWRIFETLRSDPVATTHDGLHSLPDTLDVEFIKAGEVPTAAVRAGLAIARGAPDAGRDESMAIARRP